MFAHDRGWVRKLEEAIRNGLTAEAAVERVQSETKARMIRLTDPYLRERMHDFDDLANRLLAQLSVMAPSFRLPISPMTRSSSARAMGAAELLDYPRENVRGPCAGGGGGHQPRGHRRPGHGHSGGRPGRRGSGARRKPRCDHRRRRRCEVHLRPMADLQRAYEEKVRFRARRQAQFRALRDVEPLTKDGKRITLQMNAGLLVDLPHLNEGWCEGIGLFRPNCNS